MADRDNPGHFGPDLSGRGGVNLEGETGASLLRSLLTLIVYAFHPDVELTDTSSSYGVFHRNVPQSSYPYHTVIAMVIARTGRYH